VFSSIEAGLCVQGKFLGPSEQLVKRDGWALIEKKLLFAKLPKNTFLFFHSIAENESWGHIGYHAAAQDYRIYQDIIRLTIEELLHIPVREDFQFLRIPGDSDLFLENIQEFFDYWPFNIDNKTELRRKQILSLNYGIFSNYDAIHSSSLLMFVQGRSHSSVDFQRLLVPFYGDLGFSPEVLNQLYMIARKHLIKEEGILLRLFESPFLIDQSGEAYNFADRQCYPCKGRGFRWGENLISEQYACVLSENYVLKQVEISPQLRLLMNNTYTLNPFSDLCVQRFDFYDPATIALYEKEMRSYLQNIPVNQFKLDAYRKKILKLWN